MTYSLKNTHNQHVNKKYIKTRELLPISKSLIQLRWVSDWALTTYRNKTTTQNRLKSELLPISKPLIQLRRVSAWTLMTYHIKNNNQKYI